jgi:hypothetical protein
MLILVPACGDPAEPAVPSDFILSTLDGDPVPTAYDSVFFDGTNRFMRILGAHVTIVSDDSAVYRQATDVVERLSDGSVQEWGGDCFSMRVGLRREGNRVILSYGAHASLDTAPFAPTAEDTLAVTSSGLASWRREPPTISYPDGRSFRLTYDEGAPHTPVCPQAT